MKLLITNAWKYSKNDIDLLKSIGYECYFVEKENEPIPDTLLDVDGIVCNNLFLNTKPDAFRNLKLVQLTSAGLDRVPVDYFNSHNIKLFNASGVYSIPIAEFVISSVLDLYKKKRIFYLNQEKRVWEKQRDLFELNNKNVCIVGCGSVGKACAKLFNAFGCKVIGVDLSSFEDSCFEAIIPIEQISTTLSVSDIVVIAVPLTKKTDGLFDRKLFSVMKSTSILVNIARGKIIKTNDLIDALDNKTISGAVLDVFENEPLDINSPLWKLENVIVTPHNSFVGDGNEQRLSDLVKTNLEKQI